MSFFATLSKNYSKKKQLFHQENTIIFRKHPSKYYPSPSVHIHTLTRTRPYKRGCAVIFCRFCFRKACVQKKFTAKRLTSSTSLCHNFRFACYLLTWYCGEFHNHPDENGRIFRARPRTISKWRAYVSSFVARETDLATKFLSKLKEL